MLSAHKSPIGDIIKIKNLFAIRSYAEGESGYSASCHATHLV